MDSLTNWTGPDIAETALTEGEPGFAVWNWFSAGLTWLGSTGVCTRWGQVVP